MQLSMASNLELPPDTVTQTLAILAKRRAGKSYCARRLTEQLLEAGQQVVIADPKGDWFGIRSSANGRSPGLSVVILGGEHGDIPLEAGGGEIAARLVVEERISVLLDLSLFRKHEVATFMTAFMENLYRLKAREQYRTPLMFVIDEADAIAPQRPQKGEERMLGAAEDIVRRGGQRGIGCTLITQRSAVLNKNVLTQAQALICLRTIAPQDLSAIQAWIEVHGTQEEGRRLLDSLPSLPVGDAWVWSPGWPTDAGIFQRVHILPIATFDSGATPKSGEKRQELKHLADIDLEAVTKQMAATIEKAKAEDPKLLKKRIAELEQQLAKQLAKRSVETVEKIVEQPIVLEKDLHALGTQVIQLLGIVSNLDVSARHIQTALDGVSKQSGKPSVPVSQLCRDNHRRPPSPGIGCKAVDDTPKLSNSCLRVLTSLYWLRNEQVTPVKVAFFANYTVNGHFNNTMGELRRLGLVEGWQLTQAGLGVVSADVEDKPTGGQLREWFRSKLDGPQNKLLDVCMAVGGSRVPVQQLAEMAGYTVNGHFNNCLGSLRRIDVLEGGAREGGVRANPVFFE